MDEWLVDTEVLPPAKQDDNAAVALEIVELWKEKQAAGVLGLNLFKDYWRVWVPQIYSPTQSENCLNWNINEDTAQRMLFTPLEVFICGGDPEAVLGQMAESLKPQPQCGRVFKFGEPTYSCRECGMDNTCVLCVDCFKKSEHRFHKYKMGTSTGGGCCDCGDKEAWKRSPFCDIHNANISVDQSNESLPPDMAERTRVVFDSVLWYAYDLLMLDHTADLKLPDPEDEEYDADTYCTILYNDEVHTFEQVISTINRVIKCSQRNSIEYVTNIDREGRAVVKCCSFQHCNELKVEIEKFTSRHGNKPLKVLVVHSHIVAHQVFALRLLSWLQRFLGHGPGFRNIFSQVIVDKEPSILKGILLHDSQLWKSARTHWHVLLISGMLLEYENKKKLAKIFTKHYAHAMKDFIKDDHDHYFSISSLAVQLFTVPTLAHLLIAEDDALFILLNCFISECSRRLNDAGKLEFDRNSSMLQLKRAQYILYDLRYLLSAVPEEGQWNDQLRKSFLQGLSLLLNLLNMLQGMDAVTRQVGQHMEYEPEWESAFNLHIRLAYCISLVIKWCGTDKVVLVKAYRAALKKLQENPCYDVNDKGEVRELLEHTVMCLHYDVSTKPVSIHLPLTRFLAGLHMHLEKFDLRYSGEELHTVKPTPSQLIEPVLRAQVMIAQVHAGMWRRNGYALLNQLFFYHNVKCRTEMLDRDIQLLQIGASLIESNEFLIHILNKFNLLNWANNDFEATMYKNREDDGIRQTINLVEEFLQLLIYIIGERYTPGVSNITTQDRIKKEIIQHLCIKPLAHSELNKTIPDDLTHATGLDDVIEELATFKKPTQSQGKGYYELKPEFYDDYNVFYYHYTREELSKSEEEQRKRRKAKGELECCPPPQLPQLNCSFNMLVNLLQCDVMLHIMKLVLSRSLNLRAISFSELQLHQVLHLIGYALQEEETKNYDFLSFSEKATRWKIPELLQELTQSPRVEAHKHLILWTLNKFKQVMKVEEQQDVNMEVAAGPSQEKIDSEKEIRAKKAAERRAKVMAQMAKLQSNFIRENAELFEETLCEPMRSSESENAMDIGDAEPIALGPKQSTRNVVETQHMCILCQETQSITLDGPTMVLAGFVHQATVLCQNRKEEYMDISKHDPLYLNSNLGPAPHTSTCGHVMHHTCWLKYFDNVMLKEHRRPYRLRHPASFDVDKQEYLCPLCECLSNTALPLVPSLARVQPSHPPRDMEFSVWLNCMLMATTKIIKSRLDDNIEHNTPDDDLDMIIPLSRYNFKSNLMEELGNDAVGFINLFPPLNPELSPTLRDAINAYVQVAYTRGLNVNAHPTDNRLMPMAWKSCAYTIHSIEMILRDSGKPLLGELSSRQRDCIETMVRILGVLGSAQDDSIIVSGHSLKLFTYILEHSDDSPSILEWDAFGILVAMTYSLPSIFCVHIPSPVPTGGTLEAHTLRLIFTAHIVKILLTTDVNDYTLDEDNINNAEVLEVLEYMQKSRDGLTGSAVWKHVQEASVPFLRCCVLFYHFLTDVPAPSTLQQVGGDTFSNMATYLDLPTTAKDYFSGPTLTELIRKWCNHKTVKNYCNLAIAKEPLAINRLIDLPHDYSELINMVSTFTCPNSDHEDSRNPTMCLVCGEVLCSQSYCCQTELNKVIIGACNSHAHKCGAGIGIFLRVRECEIMFLASPHRGCFVTPPYLDAYGETDQGLRRGNPLTLCPERYKKLQRQWLEHSIYEVIARHIESSSNIVQTQWQHL